MAAVAWMDAETKALLTIWGMELVQKLLAKATRNKNIYEIVSKELSKVGVERNWKQCQDCIKNFLAKYRKTSLRSKENQLCHYHSAQIKSSYPSNSFDYS